MSESRSSLIAVVLDLNPLAWGLKAALEAQKQQQMGAVQRPETFVQALDAVLTFISSSLLMTHGNQVVVVGAHPLGSEILHPSQAYTGNTASMVNRQIEAGIKRLCQTSLADERLLSSSTSPISKFNNAVAKALCYVNKQKAANKTLMARCLMIKCGADFLSQQYLPLINAAFAAEHMKVSIDAVVLDRENDVPVMQQMVEITDGIYSRVKEPAVLLQTLLTYHLPDDHARLLLSKIPQNIVDSRAICFKSKDILDIGQVCSVCLSVFKTLTPICSTCKSVLKLPGAVMPSRKRKREK